MQTIKHTPKKSNKHWIAQKQVAAEAQAIHLAMNNVWVDKTSYESRHYWQEEESIAVIQSCPNPAASAVCVFCVLPGLYMAVVISPDLAAVKIKEYKEC